MHIVARALAFVESLRRLAQRRDRDRRHCPVCGSERVYRHGHYTRHPWTMEGHVTLPVQRYRCQDCRATYSETFPDLAAGRWYARSVQRQTIDAWLHLVSSLRRVAEWMRSLMGKQERWRIWYPLSAPVEEGERCRLSHSTVCRWLNEAGMRAERQVEGMYEGIASSGQMGADGLWARLRGGTVRVLLMLRDSVTGLLWPPVVATGEEAAWAMLFARACAAGLALQELAALVSDGAAGLLSYLRQKRRGRRKG
ncbi:MAG: transposase family protein [Synergistales bacterium]|nr:transposase family protein [Synergistales bacterium]